jgi:hypothetical protein
VPAVRIKTRAAMKLVVKKYLMARKKARKSVLFIIVFISFFGLLVG